MWEYKVVTGHYAIDGANVLIKNPAGEGTLQQVLDHYGADRWELVSSTLDGVHREVVLMFKRPRGGVATVPIAMMPGMAVAPVVAAAPAPAAAQFVDADGAVVRRRVPGSPPAGAPRGAPPASGGRPGRRSKADLDKLARED
jgi:hypothetical protein